MTKIDNKNVDLETDFRLQAGLPDGLIFKQKIPIWVNFGGPNNGKCWIFYGHLEYLTALWYILWPFRNLVVIR
jgi:hypothetical protein